MTSLSRLEEVLDQPDLKDAIYALEAHLPFGVRPRQLRLRTLVLGMLACLQQGHQLAHLSAVHAVLQGLDEVDKQRLGVTVSWRSGPHSLTYRQVTYTTGLLINALQKPDRDGSPSPILQRLCDSLTEASVKEGYKSASGSYAIDWTDLESFSRPPGAPGGPCADKEAAWGHRRGDAPGQKDELFFGYYASVMTMVKDEGAAEVPELIRRSQLVSCRHDPVPGFVSVLSESTSEGVRVDDVLADIGYSYKSPENFARPLRSIGARLVMDLHPNDRGTKGTFAGAICHNGSLYCPATPRALFELGPLARDATEAQCAAHDAATGELSRYKLGRISSDDADGYHRVCCPAEMRKCRCPLREESMAAPLHSRPEIFSPPGELPPCCLQKTITVPAKVNEKTRQKHDYPSRSHRLSYFRRSAAERANARLKDPSGIDIDVHGWCKLTALAPLSLFLACACVVVNLSLIDSFEAKAAERIRRAQSERPRRHRRRELEQLSSSANAPP